jgi:hypothetical protein
MNTIQQAKQPKIIPIYYMNDQFVAEHDTISEADVDYDLMKGRMTRKLNKAGIHPLFIDCWAALEQMWSPFGCPDGQCE